MRNIIIATGLLLVTAAGAMALPTVPQLGEHHNKLTINTDPVYDPVYDAKLGNLKLGEILYGLSCGHLEHAEQIKELERKVAGMQKQITILHSKKADKEALQETRDQTANCVRMLKQKK